MDQYSSPPWPFNGEQSFEDMLDMPPSVFWPISPSSYQQQIEQELVEPFTAVSSARNTGATDQSAPTLVSAMSSKPTIREYEFVDESIDHLPDVVLEATTRNPIRWKRKYRTADAQLDIIVYTGEKRSRDAVSSDGGASEEGGEEKETKKAKKARAKTKVKKELVPKRDRMFSCPSCQTREMELTQAKKHVQKKHEGEAFEAVMVEGETKIRPKPRKR